ncbi:Zn-dependent peptidase ImmA, M78 family [Paenibacillus sp. 1_12]|uniref:helix-turn-helix domain-containing protein n=1 Tax=Paenibacillus sp. 1_12 TaxID=1566278 RepID=UPI0008F34996|nr:XRE family transcriptional regulator [Paenibacillus sp. 1_12]SFL20712.1 Zn-dependent peptidase ImmA, M78 family [Paenibacillus sp. 1_12]
MQTQFNPKKLSSARTARGFTIKELAERIGISKQAISQFELGQAIPKAETMMLIVNTLDFPKGYFFETEEEQYVGNTYFRASASITKRVREMQKERAGWVSKVYNILNQYVEFPIPNLPDLSYFTDGEWDTDRIEELAITTRNHWKLGDKPINNLVNVLESNGVIVASVELGSIKVDAFCQPRSGRSFIILGEDKKSASRRHFDAAHELGHLLMHLDVHNQDSLTKEEFKLMEQQANQFASAFLLPEDAFSSMVSSETTLDGYTELKKYWRVSIGAMIHRAKDLGIISLSRYTSLQKQISMRKMRHKEPLDDVLPVPYPTLFKKAFEVILQSGIDGFELVQKQVRLNPKDVETLCELNPGTLSLRKEDSVIKLRHLGQHQAN